MSNIDVAGCREAMRCMTRWKAVRRMMLKSTSIGPYQQTPKQAVAAAETAAAEQQPQRESKETRGLFNIKLAAEPQLQFHSVCGLCL